MKLTKPRLSFLVVFSAVVTYLTVATQIDWIKVLSLALGGFLVTGSANGFNQVIESGLDKLMTRTQNRPLPKEILTKNEALIFCFVTGLAGIILLAIYINLLSGILGLASIVLYAAVYTPLKRVTPFSVMVGAFPGAMPTLIGAVANSEGFGEITYFALLLFMIQFMWQFPHFWAIAWVSHDDYKKAGFFMLPSSGGRDQGSAFQIFIYTLFLVPISVMPWIFNLIGPISGSLVLACGIYFLFLAYKVYKQCSVETARKLMFGSFFYLPIVQLAILFGAKF